MILKIGIRSAIAAVIPAVMVAYWPTRPEATAEGDDVSPASGGGGVIRGGVPCATGETQLLHVTSDAGPDAAYDVRAVESDGSVHGLRFLGAIGDRQDFPVSGLAAGLVLMKRGGQDVVTLLCPDFSPTTGGAITLKYLYEGGMFSNDYRCFVLDLRREDGAWVVCVNEPAGRRRVRSLFLPKHEPPDRGVIGITGIVAK